MSKRNTILLWGNGSFGSTSKGHASAPNKSLWTKLKNQFKDFILVDEYGTSKHSCCHQVKATSCKTPGYNKRATVVQCSTCKTLLSRDTNAAINIFNNFKAGKSLYRKMDFSSK